MPQLRSRSVFIGRQTEVPREEFHRIRPSVEEGDVGMPDVEDEDGDEDMLDVYEEAEDTSLIVEKADLEAYGTLSPSEASQASAPSTSIEELFALGTKRELRPRTKDPLKPPYRYAIPRSKATVIEKPQRRKGATKEKKAIEKNKEWEVEAIVDSMIEAGTLKHWYKVKWKGFSSQDNTWEPKKNLANCRALLEAYEEKAKKK